MMDEKKLAEKKAHAGEKKVSMKRRDDYNDYHGRRMYMLTMEVEGRLPLFGRLVGNVGAGRGSKDAPRIELSPLGEAVSKEWMGIPRYYPQIEVMGLQMMPDHLHGILFVHEALPVHLSQVITGFKTGCNRIWKKMRETGGGVATEPQPAREEEREKGLVGSEQAGASSQRKGGRGLFAPGYNDLILKSDDEFQRWKNYLADNPRRLMVKRANPEFLYPFFGLRVGSFTYSGIGNRRLLAAPKKLSVKVSRRMVGLQLETEVARLLALAREGTVLISPAISPGEKRVMRAAFDAGLPTIVVMENGFTPMSKPRGEQFDACAEGRLLMLSAWEHHNEHRPLTAFECGQMNLMAWELSQHGD